MSQHLPVTFYAQCCMTNGWQLVLWLLLMPNCTHVRIVEWMQSVCSGVGTMYRSSSRCHKRSLAPGWFIVISIRQPTEKAAVQLQLVPPSRSPAVQLLMTLVLNFPRAVLLVPVAKFLFNPEAHMLLHSLSLSLSQECHPDWTENFECFG